MNTGKGKKVNTEDFERQMVDIDRLFHELKNDKSLPTFGEHFMQCLMLGIAERVNLKAMYPNTYKKLSKWMDKHNKSITAAR